MAQDKSAKAINLARDYVVACQLLTQAWDRIRALEERKVQGGIDWATFEGAIQAEADLAHLSANILNGVISNAGTMLAVMKDGDSGPIAAHLEDAIYEARGD